MLTGTLPSELSQIAALETFQGQNNNFTGPVVPNWEANQSSSVIEEWDVSGNLFVTGVVTQTLCGAWKFTCSGILCGCDCPCPTAV
ncbi:expressed unknown protein [Seminavis robusta]|uniref:Uncharacterized protein n=1 Tax=Seminavis robusta TaxID=568900 RepID=A0A9N8DFD6_9STRA|nr:expressed unknown protein [Seminavis robusta]|eukprot:Sro92_g048040.1 n/a (86) ;mRNA; r:38618-38875